MQFLNLLYKNYNIEKIYSAVIDKLGVFVTGYLFRHVISKDQEEFLVAINFPLEM